MIVDVLSIVSLKTSSTHRTNEQYRIELDIVWIESIKWNEHDRTKNKIRYFHAMIMAVGRVRFKKKIIFLLCGAVCFFLIDWLVFWFPIFFFFFVYESKKKICESYLKKKQKFLYWLHEFLPLSLSLCSHCSRTANRCVSKWENKASPFFVFHSQFRVIHKLCQKWFFISFATSYQLMAPVSSQEIQ